MCILYLQFYYFYILLFLIISIYVFKVVGTFINCVSLIHNSLIHSSTFPLIHLLARFSHSFIHLFIHSLFIFPLICGNFFHSFSTFIRLFIYSFSHSFVYSFVCFSHSFVLHIILSNSRRRRYIKTTLERSSNKR